MGKPKTVVVADDHVDAEGRPRECFMLHDLRCRSSKETKADLLKGACAKVTLRLPDPNTLPMPATVQHRASCYTHTSVTEDETYYPTRLHCYLARCGMKQLSLRIKSFTERFRWFVTEYTPGESLRVCLYIYWSEIADSPNLVLGELIKLGKAAEFVVPFTRFGIHATFPMLRSMLAPCLAHQDKTGADLLHTIEQNHRPLLKAVAAFIDTGDEDAYRTAVSASQMNKFAIPSIQSLQDVIDVSQYIRVQLKPYQIAAAAWALDRERNGSTMDVVQFRPDVADPTPYGGVIEFAHTYELWTAYERSMPRGNMTRGGFMLHEMGMGKTLQMLALILAADYKDDLHDDEDDDDESTPAVPASRQPLDLGILDIPVPAAETQELRKVHVSSTESASPCTPGGTLVIVPLTLMTQWVDEIQTNIVNGAKLLRPVLYHGTGRHKMTLHHSPIVITTYETISADTRHYRSEAKFREACAKVQWSCSNWPHIAPLKQARPLQRNDIIAQRTGEYFQILSVKDETVYARFITRDSLPAPLLPEEESDFMKPFYRYKMEHFTAAVIVGELRMCTAPHANGIVTECNICGANAWMAIRTFVKSEMLRTPLEKIAWQRIVLDESHKLQSTSTAVFEAVSCLKTHRKWCITGTPMPKSTENMMGQLAFLDITRTKYPQRINYATSAWLADLMVRHTKQDCLRDGNGHAILPPATYRDVLVTLADDEKHAYTTLQTETRARFAAHTDNDRMFVPQMFQLLARERRACTVILPPQATAPANKRRKVVVPELPPVPADALNPTDDCPVCYEPIPHAVMLPCRHCFCHECLLALLEANEHKCSLCQSQLTGLQIIEAQRTCRAVADALAVVDVVAPPLVLEDVGAAAPPTPVQVPTAHEKFTALLEMVRSEPRRPTLVYTQFDDVVHTLQYLLQQEKIVVYTMTGAMTRAARTASIRGFREHPDAVLVLSLRTAAVGLNLTHASRVVFMDPPMNTGLEAQACGRVHRLGQRNPVEIVHLIARGTIEERIRRFRDMDMSDETGTDVQVGRVRVIMADHQRRMWRHRQLQSLMGV